MKRILGILGVEGHESTVGGEKSIGSGRWDEWLGGRKTPTEHVQCCARGSLGLIRGNCDTIRAYLQSRRIVSFSIFFIRQLDLMQEERWGTETSVSCER